MSELVTLQLEVSQSVSLGVEIPPVFMTRFWFWSTIAVFFFVIGRPPCWEDGSIL